MLLQLDRVDVESATLLAFKYMGDSAELMQVSEARSAFAHFLQLLASSHLIDRCCTLIHLHLLHRSDDNTLTTCSCIFRSKHPVSLSVVCSHA